MRSHRFKEMYKRNVRPMIKTIASGTPASASQKKGQLMGFIGSSSTRELDAQTDLPTPDPIDEIDYELEKKLAAEASESESSSEDDATDQPANNRPISSNSTAKRYVLAFLNRGN